MVETLLKLMVSLWAIQLLPKIMSVLESNF